MSQCFSITFVIQQYICNSWMWKKSIYMKSVISICTHTTDLPSFFTKTHFLTTAGLKYKNTCCPEVNESWCRISGVFFADFILCISS